MLMAKAHKEPVNAVQVFGRKITATTVENCKHRKCMLRVNSRSMNQIEHNVLQYKLSV